ncbi:hypothetical protein BDW22DRAFT_821037 [Trametopsis cervina]|nr:hypothetical protein BDW22DRAFT_821037 [Trametopsis cervina]
MARPVILSRTSPSQSVGAGTDDSIIISDQAEEWRLVRVRTSAEDYYVHAEDCYVQHAPTGRWACVGDQNPSSGSIVVVSNASRSVWNLLTNNSPTPIILRDNQNQGLVWTLESGSAGSRVILSTDTASDANRWIVTDLAETAQI